MCCVKIWQLLSQILWLPWTGVELGPVNLTEDTAHDSSKLRPPCSFQKSPVSHQAGHLAQKLSAFAGSGAAPCRKRTGCGFHSQVHISSICTGYASYC